LGGWAWGIGLNGLQDEAQFFVVVIDKFEEASSYGLSRFDLHPDEDILVFIPALLPPDHNLAFRVEIDGDGVLSPSDDAIVLAGVL
jgi:hypothetical protein